MKKILILILLTVICYSSKLSAQDKPHFWDDVQTIKKYDKIYNPPTNPIVFIGSSSIRKWDNLERTFADYVVMNRGIGGAVVNDITYYINDILFPYNPRQIVIYVGENELPDPTATPDSIFNRTKRLLKVIRAKLPEVPIAYISIKPSPVREKFVNKAAEANKLIKNYLASEKNIVYIDIFGSMLTTEGKTRPELFVEDMLHMNLQGYEIWTKAVKPRLLKR
ncbi:MAG: GDSL-type esterase/lipase family protein [Bacteroidota bacterium]|nr:GDSL-type esterase/lipase family protein [Bacteroidota bacterium]